MKTPNDRSFSVLCAERSFVGRHIRIPVTLWKEMLDVSQRPLTYPEALFQLILHVRYADQAEKVGPDPVICRRGESYLSLLAWSKLFHWSRTRTRVFFTKLQDQELIEWESLERTTRVLVRNYDYFVGAPCTSGVEGYSAYFEDFWDEYHQTTRIPAVDKHAASQCWNKLRVNEQDDAIDGIRDYYFSLKDTKYCVKAFTYLRNKKFNDQFQPKC